MKFIDEYFKQYRDLKSRIKEMKYKLEEVEKSLYYISGVSYSDIPKSTQAPKDRLAIRIQEKDELIEEIQEMEKEKRDLEKEHLRDIYKLENDKYRTIIRAYYINDLTIEKISNLLNVSVNHVYKMKRNADYIFSKLIQNDSN